MLGQKYLGILTTTITSILKPNLTLEGIYPPNQFVMNYMTNMKDNLTDERRSPAGNKRLAQWRVTWLIEHSTSHQLLWLNESFVLRNPPLLQAPNRYMPFYKKPAKMNTTKRIFNGTILSILIFLSISFITVLLQLNSLLNRQIDSTLILDFLSFIINSS